MVSTTRSAPSSTFMTKDLMYLIYHIFLPPELPHKDDFNPHHQMVMIDTTLEALLKFKNHVTGDQSGIVESVVAMVTKLKNVHVDAGGATGINEERLQNAMSDLSEQGGTIPLYIAAQNAAVLFSKVDNSVHVEAFELSPRNQAVITTKGRLRRSFPGPAFSVSMDAFGDPGLQATAAHTLAKMAHQPADNTKPKVKKAGYRHDEDRDSTHPKMVTELFLGFLGAVGKPVDVLRLWKNTREEVLWRDCLLPWRRSAMWLLIRTAMQLLFSRRTASSEPSEDLYKSFMVFLMSRVLELSQQHRLPSGLLYAMNAKVARRLLKLDSATGLPGLDFVHNIMRNMQTHINSRWSNIVTQAEPPCDLSNLESLDFNLDTVNMLPQLDAYIQSIAEREMNQSSLAFHPPSTLVRYQPDELPSCLDSSTGDYLTYNLKALEVWVASHLTRWLSFHKSHSSTCHELGDLIRSYYRVANNFYSDNPEGISTMLLTILELWIACDKSATEVCELLKDYDVGIPQELLQSLVLPSKSQLERLFCAENYLRRRRNNAMFGAHLVYQDFGHSSCFSVRYFGDSIEHQRLLESIESRAAQDRREKQDEIHEKKKKYKSLMQNYEKAQCEYYEFVVDSLNDFREDRHSKSCRRCSYQKQAANLTIEVHEWPLPRRPLEAQSTVFELKVPCSFGLWRDTTVFVLLDVMKNENVSAQRPRASYPLNKYKSLSRDFVPFTQNQRIGLLSQAKPHTSTHRSEKYIGVSTEDDICLDNGMRYQYHDSTTDLFIGDFDVTDTIPHRCVYNLPARSSRLKRFLFRPASTPSGLPPNTVIASQSECPDHMSLNEYKSLSTIPLGHRIQWQNILIQLSMPSVDFKKVETGMTILQCIYQAGPSDTRDVLRAGHEIVGDSKFAHALLKSLRGALERLQENWESFRALGFFISLATRLLSLTSVKKIATSSLAFLASTRAVTFGWVNLLRDRAHKAATDEQRTELTSKAVEIALICVDSFSVDDGYLTEILSTPGDASLLIQCFIVIDEGHTSIPNNCDPMVPIVRRRWTWLSYRTYPLLARGIVETRIPSLDDAIKKSWSAYQAGDGWQVVSEESDHWLVSKTAHEGEDGRLWVHFDLLTGTLLVNGHPLARLPLQYERHPIYQVLFGRSVLEVMPSTVQGMRFSGKREFNGFTLHFGMNDVTDGHDSSESDLLIQAVKDGQRHELIPRRILRDMFPIAFVDDFVHWYNVNDDYLEFRSVKDPWTSSAFSWRLTRATINSDWHLTKGEASLVHVKSETARVLSKIFLPLEDPYWIHPIFDQVSASLEIELPRLQLAFQLKSGERSIQSRQFRGMVIDSDQSLGTIVGLSTRLILKCENGGNRLLVLPKGNVLHKKKDDHIHVAVDRDSVNGAYGYYIDPQIGRLVDNGSLQSKLFLCFLHALTSFCLPDPLIRRTGTEQALSILNSAAVRSFDRLGTEHHEVLAQIAHLTPARCYYPANERSMQTVTWSPQLSFLVQHGGYHKSVTSLFNQANRARIFYPESYVQHPTLDHADPDLLERDSIRSSTFRVSGFGAEDHTVNYDVTYSPRDQAQDSTEGFKAFIMSSIVYRGREALHYPFRDGFRINIWDFLSQTPTIFGPRYSLPLSEINYDAGWLLDSSTFLATHWSGLHETLSLDKDRINKFRIMIWLSTLAFAKEAHMEILQTIAFFLTLPEMAQIIAPAIHSLRLSRGARVNESELRSAVQSAFLPFRRCPEAGLPKKHDETSSAFKKRQRSKFRSNQNSTLDELTDKLKVQWPSETIATPVCDSPVDFHAYIDVEKVMDLTKPMFKSWFDNVCFDEYLGRIAHMLQYKTNGPMEMPSTSFVIPRWNLPRRRGYVGISDILACPAPLMPPCRMGHLNRTLSSRTTAGNASYRLSTLVERLEARAGSNYQKSYVEDLKGSLSSLHCAEEEHCLQLTEAALERTLLDHRTYCKRYLHRTYEALLTAVTDNRYTSAAAAIVKQLPRLSPIFFLFQLTQFQRQELTESWKHCIIEYALAHTYLQRAQRLLKISGNHADLIKELRNSGHTNWRPLDHPLSLLLEVESGILIREVQERIAGEMRRPQSGQNAVMQLNMGEGKSSVIAPIVAAALADGSRLVRVFVAKPQAKQMFQMLVTKLGGLLDRPVYHMPFSRALRFGTVGEEEEVEVEVETIRSTCLECVAKGGILLVQPEHVLSFQLMGLESLISGKEAVGRSLLRAQENFDRSTRDIVDESDEIFSVRFELIYTMGQQRPIEFSPERWICIQQVLGFIKMFAPVVKQEFPHAMEVFEICPGRFPRTRVLQTDAQQRIISLVAEQICGTGVNNFPIARQPEAVRQAVFDYMTKPTLAADEIARVESQGAEGIWPDNTRNALLLLRGLLAGGVLAFALCQKRWRVNYGLDTGQNPRTKLAVPYRAKDSPSARSEFSHPDVVIVLTCLSYYYGGLADDDLFLALGHVLRSDQAIMEYQAWVKDAPSLPSAFHQLVGINLKDRLQCIEKIFPAFRHAKSVIDYFLAHIIFPKYTKEFPQKLSTSGWDIGRIKSHPTRGFSGTNDSRKTLPLGVEYLDLPEQKHTNALVLEYLLRPENLIAPIPPRQENSGSDADILLAMVTRMEPPAQVILDVGAQVLELGNLGVAKEWLEMTADDDGTQAVVFFDENDELSVVDRKGQVELLQTSSFAERLDVCLVFLDEAHTRGTDLRLPGHYRAAVTLGANLTKDRLVQACMRMRKLGKGQAVVFCVPEEIKNKILRHTSKAEGASIDVSDVLIWSISESWSDMRQSMPLWAAQGQRFEHQATLRSDDGMDMSKEQAGRFLENDCPTLEERYRPRSGTDVGSVVQVARHQQASLIMARCREFDGLDFKSAELQEEQERELCPEIEQERQMERPGPAQAARHHIHSDVAQFVRTGILVKGSQAYQSAFETLRNTSAAAHLDVSQFPQDLLVTADYANTIRGEGGCYIADLYQRPVQWILTHPRGSASSRYDSAMTMMIISPYEAQELLPEMQKSKGTTLHLYAPRPNLGFRALDGLDLYRVPMRPGAVLSIPRSLIVQLNLFAGQLYVGSFREYTEVCDFLGLAWKESEEGDGVVVAADGFIIRDGKRLQGSRSRCRSKFSDSPVKFLNVFMSKIRRGGEAIDKTHMGEILGGRLLRPSDFEEH